MYCLTAYSPTSIFLPPKMYDIIFLFSFQAFNVKFSQFLYFVDKFRQMFEWTSTPMLKFAIFNNNNKSQINLCLDKLKSHPSVPHITLYIFKTPTMHQTNFFSFAGTFLFVFFPFPSGRQADGERLSMRCFVRSRQFKMYFNKQIVQFLISTFFNSLYQLFTLFAFFLFAIIFLPIISCVFLLFNFPVLKFLIFPHKKYYFVNSILLVWVEKHRCVGNAAENINVLIRFRPINSVEKTVRGEESHSPAMPRWWRWRTHHQNHVLIGTRS